MNDLLNRKVDNSWLLVVMDLVLLLICFFVMLYSLLRVTIEQEKSFSEKLNFGRNYQRAAIASTSLMQLFNLLNKNNNDDNIKITLANYNKNKIVRILIPNDYIYLDRINQLDFNLSPLLFNIRTNKINIHFSYKNFVENYQNVQHVGQKDFEYVIHFAAELRTHLVDNLSRDDVDLIFSLDEDVNAGDNKDINSKNNIENQRDSLSDSFIYIDILDYIN